MDNPRYFEEEIFKAKAVMAQLGFDPVKLEDIVADNCIVMVDVQRLCAHNAPPSKLGEAGTSVICIDNEPIREHERIAGRKVVHFRHIERASHRPDFVPLEEILRDEYDPRVANSSDTRYFVRRKRD